MPERAAVAVLCALLPEHFRDRQRDEWRGDLTQLERRGQRWRYLTAAALTLPSLYAVARRHGGRPQPATPWAYGVRALTPPRDAAARTLIGLFALTTALFAAAGAGRLSWTPPHPLMPTAEAQALAATVFPGRAVTGSPDAPAFADEEMWAVSGGTVYEVTAADPNRDHEADSRGAVDRLRAQGWTIESDLYSTLDPGGVGAGATRDAEWRFYAYHHGVSLAFTASRHGDEAQAWYKLRRTSVPHPDPTLLLAAAAPTALLGWLVGCRVYRRTRRSGTGTAIRTAAVAVGLLAVVPTAALMIAVRHVPALRPEPDAPWWYSWFVAAGDHPYGYVAAIVVLACWLALFPKPPARRPYERG